MQKYKTSIKDRAQKLAVSKLFPLNSCEICGKENNLIMHHLDYNYPLIVVTLCSSCHAQVHHDQKDYHYKSKCKK